MMQKFCAHKIEIADTLKKKSWINQCRKIQCSLHSVQFSAGAGQAFYTEGQRPPSFTGLELTFRFPLMFNHTLCLALLIQKLSYAYIVESELLGYKPLVCGHWCLAGSKTIIYFSNTKMVHVWSICWLDSRSHVYPVIWSVLI